MSELKFDFNQKFSKKKLLEFANVLMQMQEQINFKVSARGWCYLMEGAGYINKSQFNKVDEAVNRCRKEGYIPVNFVAEEDARAFKGVEHPNGATVRSYLKSYLNSALNGGNYYTPDWWEGEEYYIQMIVEKVDLISLFQPVCEEYHIAIANAKGWSSILQRAEYAQRFKQAELKGLQCVLLYCGDHDPDGLRISDTIRKNLEDIQNIYWDNGELGYNPCDLIIERFGLNYQFIIDNGYTWIDNLFTGRGGELAKVVGGKIVQGTTENGKPHKNFNLPYLQTYLREYGVRKCEANAIVTTPDKAEELVRGEIERWIGSDALDRFAHKRQKVLAEYQEELTRSGIDIESLEDYINS